MPHSRWMHPHIVKPEPGARHMKRTPEDGEPYYCSFCGSGWNEYGACEDVRCKLESEEIAAARLLTRGLNR